MSKSKKEEAPKPALPQGMEDVIPARARELAKLKIAKGSETLEYLGEIVKDDRRLGRSIIHFDPRSRSFAATDILEAKKPGNQTWFRRGVFDQGATSSCVGQSVAGLALSSPNRKGLTAEQLGTVDPYVLYRTAQRDFDPWQGEEPDYFGTSVLAGMKAARAAGLIVEYRWCFGLKDVVSTLTHYGPVVIGVNWYSSFDEPGSDGRIEIEDEAWIRGGHAVELTGVNVDEKTVRGVNSWGSGWGDRGRFEMSFDTLDRLLSEAGEAVTGVFASRQVEEGKED